MRGQAARLGAVMGLALALAGCNDTRLDLAAGGADPSRAVARGSLTSPGAATVALVSLEGAPDPVAARFRGALSADAAAHEVAMTDEVSARYLARAYLSAYPASGDGVQVAFAYDLFDAHDHNRRRRVSDTMDVPGNPADPWSAVTPTVLSTLVNRSADALATSLGGMP